MMDSASFKKIGLILFLALLASSMASSQDADDVSLDCETGEMKIEAVDENVWSFDEAKVQGCWNMDQSVQELVTETSYTDLQTSAILTSISTLDRENLRLSEDGNVETTTGCDVGYSEAPDDVDAEYSYDQDCEDRVGYSMDIKYFGENQEEADFLLDLEGGKTPKGSSMPIRVGIEMAVMSAQSASGMSASAGYTFGSECEDETHCLAEDILYDSSNGITVGIREGTRGETEDISQGKVIRYPSSGDCGEIGVFFLANDPRIAYVDEDYVDPFANVGGMMDIQNTGTGGEFEETLTEDSNRIMVKHDGSGGSDDEIQVKVKCGSEDDDGDEDDDEDDDGGDDGGSTTIPTVSPNSGWESIGGTFTSLNSNWVQVETTGDDGEESEETEEESSCNWWEFGC